MSVLCCGPERLVAIDVDVLCPLIAIDIEARIQEDLGVAPRRIGKALKSLWLFRCSEDFRKHKTGVYDINGDDCSVEILAEGQQFAAFGIYPGTQKQNEWPDKDISELRPEGLTVVSPEKLALFINHCELALGNADTLKGGTPAAG